MINLSYQLVHLCVPVVTWIYDNIPFFVSKKLRKWVRSDLEKILRPGWGITVIHTFTAEKIRPQTWRIYVEVAKFSGDPAQYNWTNAHLYYINGIRQNRLIKHDAACFDQSTINEAENIIKESK